MPAAAGTPTVRAAVDQASRRIDRLDSRLLIQFLLGISHADYLAHPERRLAPEAEAEACYLGLVERRANGEPLAYITGEREFYGRSFLVTPAVLIPRPDTELLVQLGLERLADSPGARVLDLGTGSGAIAVSLAAECRTANVSAIDVSAAAIDVARRNAARHGVAVRFLAGDWYLPVGGERFHLIAANPPYIAAADPHLVQDGLPFEPELALTDHGDGYACLRRIIAGGGAHLEAGGWLLCEHGYEQAATCRELFRVAGFQRVGSWRDLAGIERVSGGQWAPKP